MLFLRANKLTSAEFYIASDWQSPDLPVAFPGHHTAWCTTVINMKTHANSVDI